MRRGELSNETLPRVYIVFENLIGLLPDTKTKLSYNLAVKRKKWEQAADHFQLNTNTQQGMRYLYWQQNFRIDVITFIDPAIVSPVRDRLDSRNLLFGDVHYYDKELLLADLTYDPAIICVLDPDPSRILTWGSKGRYCSASQLNLLHLIT